MVYLFLALCYNTIRYKELIVIYEYFKMLEELVSDSNSMSIKDITIQLATKAGYSKKPHTFKNGNIRIMTSYSRKFDDVLVAKWLLFYKPLFISKLCKHPELSEYHIQIINRTFLVVMRSLTVSKIVSDNVINKYVNLSLANRIGEALYQQGSVMRLNAYNSKESRKLRLKSSINCMSSSLEAMSETGFKPIAPEDIQASTIVLDLKNKLKDNKIGLKLLYYMLNSNYRVQLNNIDTYMCLDRYECTPENKANIVSAYNTIKATLRLYLNEDGSSYKWSPIKSIKYSFE